MRREGESVDSENSDSNGGNDGDGLQLKPAKKNRRVRFYDDDLHSDDHLTDREIREADDTSSINSTCIASVVGTVRI